MYNEYIEITKDNEGLLFINAVIENLKYGLISLEAIFRGEITADYYENEHTFYFYHLQSLLAAQGNIRNILFGTYRQYRTVSKSRVQAVRDAFGIDLNVYPLLKNSDFRNTNMHFDERYYTLCLDGDLNLLRKTDENYHVLINLTHLRALDLDNFVYISCGVSGKRITMDLRALQDEMQGMLNALTAVDLRKYCAQKGKEKNQKDGL